MKGAGFRNQSLTLQAFNPRLDPQQEGIAFNRVWGTGFKVLGIGMQASPTIFAADHRCQLLRQLSKRAEFACPSPLRTALGLEIAVDSLNSNMAV